MEKTLGEFVVALRKADLEVSPAETLDAMHALDIIGVEDKRLLRDSLSIILAKTPEEKASFDVCFERFFSFRHFETAFPIAADGSPNDQGGTLAMAEEGEGDREARSPGKRRRNTIAHFNSKLGHLLLGANQAELSVMMRQAAREVGLERIRTLRERSLYARRILLHMGLGQLDEEIARLEHSGDDNNIATAQRLIEGKRYLVDEVKDFVEEQYLLLVDGTGGRFISEAVSQTKLTNMQVYYFEHIREAVRKLANQLAKRHAKRRKIYNRGHLDVRKTLRRNLQYDGSLFDIKWKQIKLERPKVFVICDVSGSVKNVSRFLLTFLYSLSEVLPRVRAFAFSNELGEVTELFEKFPVDDAIQMSLDDYGKGSTDYGQAFRKFRELALSDVDGRSTIIILGDSRNNYFAPGTAVLKQIAGKARQVIWLNPETRDRWREGDAEMSSYLPFCQYADVCNSLADLERMVSRVLRSAQ
ncbi:MAG TPA: VWA domain-containing protein [Pseudomonadales bacterium]|nr:VWA domain-containing protein [Pseudomonadales bacterium]